MVKGNFWVTPVVLAAFATMVLTGCDSPTGNGNDNDNDNDIPGADQPRGKVQFQHPDG